MKIMTQFIGDDWGYFVIRDVTSFYNDVSNEEGTEKASKYFANCSFNSQKEIEDGTYAASVLESIGQSDECPPNMYTKDFSVTTTILYEIKKETN